ncbi:MAG: metallophosphoesterase [Terracidiphilus sp.]
MGILFVQGLLLLAHWFLYATWAAYWGAPVGWAGLAVKAVLFLLAISFTTAALLGFYSSSPLVSALYWVASVWLGTLNFLFYAAILCRAIGVAAFVFRLPLNRPALAGGLLVAALATSLYGLVNARIVHMRRITVTLPGLPASWRGRTALVISDLHLGHIHGVRFSRKVAARARALNPDIIFLPGDLFDGSHADAERLAAPLVELKPPLGFFFTAGNHDEFGPMNHYTQVLARGGVRVLNNERVTVDGLHIVGVPYGDASFPIRLRTTLEGLKPLEGEAVILLNHVPNRLPIAEQAGVSLQLSGHTHGGQLIPVTWFTRRAFGRYTYGFQRYGRLQVLTSSGAGTWGPPMRVGTESEMVLLRFE